MNAQRKISLRRLSRTENVAGISPPVAAGAAERPVATQEGGARMIKGGGERGRAGGKNDIITPSPGSLTPKSTVLLA